jgi:hypothetical protein
MGVVVKKDLLKQSQSASKSRSAKDLHLEVCLRGKDLGDDGLEIACEGFQQVLPSGSLKLDDLNLSENGLTVRGLKALGDVIQLAAEDLRRLDLSRNAIAVVSEEEQRIWEGFLQSFREVSRNLPLQPVLLI